MTVYTRTFESQTPPARYDELAYTTAIILESATQNGTYTVIDTITLDPVDADPTTPATRNFTTDEATLIVGWYKIRWQDAAGAQFNSDPIEYFSDYPYTGDYTDLKSKLARMTDAETEPALTDDDLSDLLDASARVDASGYYRTDSDWTPTWDLNAGAAEGWLRKAGRAAKDFTFAEDGQRFDRAQVYQHCMSQHELYARKGMGAIT